MLILLIIVSFKRTLQCSVLTVNIVALVMADMLLDPAIRTWVFLPIVLITFLIGIVRHYVAILFTSKKKIEMQQVQDRYSKIIFSCNPFCNFYSHFLFSHYLIRGRMLRENGRFLPKQSFLMRKSFFNDEETGYFKKGLQRPAVVQNPITGIILVFLLLLHVWLNVWLL